MSFVVTSQAGIEKRKFHIRDRISNTCTLLLFFGNPARAQYTIAKMKMWCNLSCVETRLCCAIVSFLLRSLNIALTQCKLHNIFKFAIFRETTHFAGFLLQGAGGASPQNDFCPYKAFPPLKFSKNNIETIAYCFEKQWSIVFPP